MFLLALAGTLMSATDEDELTGRVDDPSGHHQRSPEVLSPLPSTVLVPAMVPLQPKAAPARSVTPEPLMRPGSTRPGASPKVLDVDSVSMSGASLGVESVWMAEVTASSEEFTVDVSLSTGVTIVVRDVVPSPVHSLAMSRAPVPGRFACAGRSPRCPRA